MPVSEGKYRCNFCEDIINAESNDFSKCKCGKSEIKLSTFGYSYKRGSEVTKIEHISYHLEEEFVKFTEDIQIIFDEIKKIKEENGYKYYLHEMTDKGKNGERYLSQINITYEERVHEYSNEQNEISLSVYLDRKSYEGHEQTKNRLQKFLNMMKEIESGILKISNRKKMIELANTEDIYYNEQPTGETNYTFYL